MDIPTPSNVNHGFSHSADGFLNIPLESTNLDALSTKRRRCFLLIINFYELIISLRDIIIVRKP